MALTARLGFRRRRDDDRADAIDLVTSDVVGYSADARGWDPRTQRVVHPVDTDTAHAAHLGGRSYAVVRREAGQIVVIGVRGDQEIHVTRFDQSGTVPVEAREFRELDGRLWLRGIKRTNGGDGVPVDRRITDWFTWVGPDTSASWTRFDAASPQGRSHEVRLDWPADRHWFDWPAFGAYESLTGQADRLRRLWPGVEPLAFLGR